MTNQEAEDKRIVVKDFFNSVRKGSEYLVRVGRGLVQTIEWRLLELETQHGIAVAALNEIKLHTMANGKASRSAEIAKDALDQIATTPPTNGTSEGER